MTEGERVRKSKFLSLVLRHKPEAIGLTLDEWGWAHTSELINKATASRTPITLEDLKDIVAHNDKKRFVFTADFCKIRAAQGHSIHVDLQLEPVVPPQELFHGTAETSLASIKAKGLVRGARHHVHLSADPAVAIAVGKRYGKPVVLQVAAGKMHDRGFTFYQAHNGVWLTDFVPPEYLSVR